MASIHQRPDGNWHVSFRLGGKQFKPSLKTTSESKAKAKQAVIEETLQLIDTGRITLPSNATHKEVINFILSGGKQTAKPNLSATANFKSVVDQYFAAYTAGKEPSTIAGERIHTDHLLRLIGEKTLIASISSDTLQKYAAKRCKEKGQRGRTLSAETVKKEFRTFAQVWGMARAKGYVTGPSPTRAVKLDLLDEKPPFRTWGEIETIVKRGNLSDEEQKEYWDCVFLDETQVLEFVDHVEKNAEHPFLYAALAFAAFTGARRSEIIRSKIEDWDFAHGVVKIREKKGSRKNKTTFREVNIHPKLKAIMTGMVQDPSRWRVHHRRPGKPGTQPNQEEPARRAHAEPSTRSFSARRCRQQVESAQGVARPSSLLLLELRPPRCARRHYRRLDGASRR